MPQGKGTYGSKVGRPPKKMKDGGSSTKKKKTPTAADLNRMIKALGLSATMAFYPTAFVAHAYLSFIDYSIFHK